MVSDKGIGLLGTMEQQGFLPVEGWWRLLNYDRGMFELHEGRSSGRRRGGRHGYSTESRRTRYTDEPGLYINE